jgi:hypothetical protein
VSRLEDEWKYGHVLRLNITWNETNGGFAKKHKVEQTPLFILFDARGREMRRWAGSTPEAVELTSSAISSDGR